jgi:hypothetical protein
MCVHPNLAALSDTSGMMTTMYQFNEDPAKHAAMFYKYLEHAVTVVNTDEVQNYMKFAKAYADNRFNIDKISSQWESLLKELLEMYPTIESRKPQSEMFVYIV